MPWPTPIPKTILTAALACIAYAGAESSNKDARVAEAIAYDEDVVALLQTAQFNNRRAAEGEAKSLTEALQMLEYETKALTKVMATQAVSQRSSVASQIAALQQQLQTVREQRNQAMNEAQQNADSLALMKGGLSQALSQSRQAMGAASGIDPEPSTARKQAAPSPAAPPDDNPEEAEQADVTRAKAEIQKLTQSISQLEEEESTVKSTSDCVDDQAGLAAACKANPEVCDNVPGLTCAMVSIANKCDKLKGMGVHYCDKTCNFCSAESNSGSSPQTLPAAASSSSKDDEEECPPDTITFHCKVPVWLGMLIWMAFMASIMACLGFLAYQAVDLAQGKKESESLVR